MIIDFNQKREAAGTAAKYNRLTEQNKVKVEGFTAGLLAGYDFQTLYNALSLQDKQTIDSYINSLTAEQTQPQRGALKNGY